MQNSIKVENAVLGETTFSGGISTTTDSRLGAESGGGSSGTPYKHIEPVGSGLTNKQVFDLMKDNIVIFYNTMLYDATYDAVFNEILFNTLDGWWEQPYNKRGVNDEFYMEGSE